MDKKLVLLIVVLVLALIAFYISNPRKSMIGNLDTTKLNLPTQSSAPASSPAQSPSPTPQVSPVASPTTLPDGLIVQDITLGSGAEVKSGDNVTMQYVGTLENGQKFDSSYDRNQPFTTQIGVGQVIKGWDEGVPGMKVGGKRKLIIPPDLGYGAQAVGPIPANSTLIFEVELLKVN